MKKIVQIQYAFTTVLLLSTLLSACSRKDGNEVTPPQNTTADQGILGIIERYYKLTHTKADGTFMFESNLCNNDPSLTNIAISGGLFYDKNGVPMSEPGSFSIGQYQFEQDLKDPHQKTTYGFNSILPQSGLYGTNVTFIIKPPASQVAAAGSGATQVVTATVYSPLPISITNIPPRTPVTLTANTSTTLTWTKDPNNPNGVVIIAEYLPARYANRALAAAGVQTPLENSINVPDNGSYAIPWSFFSGYHTGAHIILWVARGNYTIAANGTYNYQVGGYTAASVWDVQIPTPPAINGQSSFSLNSSKSTGSGTITATPDSTVTVTVFAGGPGSTYVTNFQMTGANFSSGSNSCSAYNYTFTSTFIMPSSGSVNWTASYYASDTNGSGSISVK